MFAEYMAAQKVSRWETKIIAALIALCYVLKRLCRVLQFCYVHFNGHYFGFLIIESLLMLIDSFLIFFVYLLEVAFDYFVVERL